MRLLRELAAGLAPADSRAAALGAAEHALAQNQSDLPFSLTYLFDDDGAATLACATGMTRDHPCAPALLVSAHGCWDLGPIWRGEDSVVVALAADLAWPTGAWAQPPTHAVMVPLAGQGRDQPRGALIVGLNPLRPIDDDYLGFVTLLAGQLASSLANAEAYEAERQRAGALAEERDRLRTLFEQAPSFMALLRGPQHEFELVNEAYLQLVGHRNLLGLSVHEALPELRGQGYIELLDKVYRTGEAFVGRNLAADLQRDPGGPLEQRFLHLIYQPLLDGDGKVSGIFVDGYDVTDQQRAESALQALNATLEQRVVQRTGELADALDSLKRESAERVAAEAALRHAQKMESIGALTGGIAHDFNNLLQVISGNLQLLMRHVAGSAPAEKRVQNALAGVARGAKLASQLLAFGRRQPLEPKVVNIGRFIKGMDDLLRRALGEEIELETVMSGGLWNNLVDPAQIENALLNLVINARDAMDGRGRLTIEAGNAMLDDAYALVNADVQAGQYVMVAVTDTGSGIPPEIMDRVFEPFFSTKHGARPVHGLRLRQTVRRPHEDLQRGRRGHDRAAVPAAGDAVGRHPGRPGECALPWRRRNGAGG